MSTTPRVRSAVMPVHSQSEAPAPAAGTATAATIPHTVPAVIELTIDIGLSIVNVRLHAGHSKAYSVPVYTPLVRLAVTSRHTAGSPHEHRRVGSSPV
jgi:hypothetical protein